MIGPTHLRPSSSRSSRTKPGSASATPGDAIDLESGTPSAFSSCAIYETLIPSRCSSRIPSLLALPGYVRTEHRESRKEPTSSAILDCDAPTACVRGGGRSANWHPRARGFRDSAACRPTPSDGAGPFQQGGVSAPRRAKIGTGHVLQGRVLQTDCKPVAGALVVLWQAGPNGYGPGGRGSVRTDRSGRFRFKDLSGV